MFDTLLLLSLSKLWQLLFMERSALLSHPPISESDSDDSEEVSVIQSRPIVSSDAAEVREPEPPSRPEQERSTRLNRTPGVEGCVDMVHKHLPCAC